jgi:hypothetical protein
MLSLDSWVFDLADTQNGIPANPSDYRDALLHLCQVENHVVEEVPNL